MAIAPSVQLTSKIDKVKVYAAGATVTRVAQLPMGETWPTQVEIPELPLALEDGSVRVWVEASNRPAGAGTPIATDIRLGLTVAPSIDPPSPVLDDELRSARATVKHLEDLDTLITHEIHALQQLRVPDRPAPEPGKAPPPSPMGARLALANFSQDQVQHRLQEKRELQTQLRQARIKLAELRHQQLLASTAKEVKPEQLRKTARIRLSSAAALTLVPSSPPSRESSNPNPNLDSNSPARLLIEYFVPGARWTPTYVCRVNSETNTAAIAVRAMICQKTGEDWNGVKLALSTAEPTTWCDLPELPSLRLGRAQKPLQKRSWRTPPAGTVTLFKDFDQQKGMAEAEVPQQDIASLTAPVLQPVEALSPVRSVPDDFEEPITMGQEEETADLRELTVEVPALAGFEVDLPEADLEGTVPSRAAFSKMAMRVMPAQPPIDPSNAHHMAGLKSRKRSGARRSETPTFSLNYRSMQLEDAENAASRGKLLVRKPYESEIERLKRGGLRVRFNIADMLEQAVTAAQNCLAIALPTDGIQVRQAAGSFDYAYEADGRVDVHSDGQFHTVALTHQETEVEVRYVGGPRESTHVFRVAQLRNPLRAPLLSGPADLYVNGEYILSTKIDTVPSQGKFELGLGVEQAIKMARNTTYQEARSGETVVSFNELRHCIQIELNNLLPRPIQIEVRERLPLAQDGEKVEVQIDHIAPDWEAYEQEERSKPIQGGYRWQVEIPGGAHQPLAVHYTIKTFVDSELVDGNRREEDAR